MEKKCIACDRADDVIPLIPFDFKGGRYWICPQHMPLLIHKPEQLTGKLPGAEDLAPADGV
jgi:hypothetical protein